MKKHSNNKRHKKQGEKLLRVNLIDPQKSYYIRNFHLFINEDITKLENNHYGYLFIGMRSNRFFSANDLQHYIDVHYLMFYQQCTRGSYDFYNGNLAEKDIFFELR